MLQLVLAQAQGGPGKAVQHSSPTRVQGKVLEGSVELGDVVGLDQVLDLRSGFVSGSMVAWAVYSGANAPDGVQRRVEWLQTTA